MNKPNVPKPVRRHAMLRGLSWACLLCALILLAINVLGFFLPFRAPEINGYVDFAGGTTTSAQTTLRRLQAVPRNAYSLEIAAAATRIIHEGIAHVAPADIDRMGLDHFAMRVPATENWVLYALSYLKPDTYGDYEFCSYKRAVERGTGRCGQQSLALVSFLEERGFDTGFVSLGGHAIATAKVEKAGWILLDPDYGGVIPFDLAGAEADPESVLPFYWSLAAKQNRLDRLFSPRDNETRLGGVTARYARACPIETLAYWLKWLVPLLLLLPMALVALLLQRRERI